jgi:glycosyltransferase involved in cell wall biosynthesis
VTTPGFPAFALKPIAMDTLISDPPSFQSLPFVSIIVPARNEASYIERCLTTLQCQSYPRQQYEIVLVDNGSVDDTILTGRQYADIVLSVQGVHVSAVRNFGAKNARGSIYAFIDADCAADFSWIENAVNLIQETLCICGSRCRVPADGTWVERAWFGGISTERYEAVYINSGNLVVPASIFNSLGGFNANLVTGEDYEFCLRAGNHVRIISDPGIGVVHYGYPKTLRQFVLREVWHGIGAFGTIRQKLFDKPLLGTLVFLITICLGVIGVIEGRGTLLGISFLGMLALLVASALYRGGLSSGFLRVFQLLVLYFLYYAGRATSVFFILGKKHFVRRR